MSASVEWEATCIFVNAEEPVLARVRPHVRVCVFPAQQTIFDEGDSASDLYILRSGQVELTYTLPTRRDASVRIRQVHPGDVFAWSALVGDMKLTARAQALEESQAFLIPAIELRQVMDEVPVFGYQVMDRLAALLAGRLRDTRAQLQWLHAF
jgi:CRP-like cAMP-binding protein